MGDLIIPTDQAIDRIVDMIRKRLEDARASGHTVRMTARETGQTSMRASEFSRQSITQIVERARPAGFELHIYIEGMP